MAAFTRSSACKTLPHGGIPAFTRVVLEGQDETMETKRMGQDEREREKKKKMAPDEDGVPSFL